MLPVKYLNMKDKWILLKPSYVGLRMGMRNGISLDGVAESYDIKTIALH